MLTDANIEFTVNPLGRKLSEFELANFIGPVEILIAGTEPITEAVLRAAPNLQLISRVGIGLDNVDLEAARRRGITVTYTPDAPAPAVAEMTIGLMLSLLRSIHTANLKMHDGEWERFAGRRISEVTIGIIGVGRIGLGVLRRLSGFSPRRVLVNDLAPTQNLPAGLNVDWSEKDYIYQQADVISLHVPLTAETHYMIDEAQLLVMKSNALLLNTARGGIVNEDALAHVLGSGNLGGAALDVFEKEPYQGPLSSFANCLLTSHMGSMSEDCRARMEVEATEDAVRFAEGSQPLRPVPEFEYENQRMTW